jgi:tetratricopeptide (TPR) repeat protein
MAGRVTNALIRREVDAYRSQGLEDEALALLRKALSASPPPPAEVKATIEQQIEQIEAEQGGGSFEEGQQLSEEQMAVIRYGWGDEATSDEFAVCADSLHGLGFYEDALVEFRKSVQKGYSLHRVIEPVADCLVHLHDPLPAADASDGWAAETVQSRQERFNVKLSIAEQMWKTGHGGHAAAIARHLAEVKEIPGEYRLRLDALLERSRTLRETRESLLDSNTQNPVEPSRIRSIFEWIRKSFGALQAKR